MKVLGNTVNPELTVLCCAHGDELFGLTVFNALMPLVDSLPGLLLILGNEEAIRAGKREVDSNLNRIYPGRPDGDTEERLAHQIVALMRNSRWMIDIHTTRTSLELAAIVSKFNPGVKEILAHTRTPHVFRMPEFPSGIDTASIDQVGAGVGLEFGHRYAETMDALGDVLAVVHGLLGSERPQPHDQVLYQFGGKFPLEFDVGDGLTNFEPVQFEGAIVWPFLVGSDNYLEEGHRGFYATSCKPISHD